MIELLRKNKAEFTWSPMNILGLDPSVAIYILNLNPNAITIAQKKRMFAKERQKVIVKEVDKLNASKCIREVQFPTWLSNVVLVKKANGKWRMCVDFTNLNYACPKNCFTLLMVDQLVDGTAGFEYLSSLDTYSGYHQILMDPEDEEKIAFLMDVGTFYYKVMPFSL